MKIELSRQDAIDMVALLVVCGSLAESLFRDYEFNTTRTSALGENILKQLLDDGLVITEAELHERVEELSPKDSNIGDMLNELIGGLENR